MRSEDATYQLILVCEGVSVCIRTCIVPVHSTCVCVCVCVCEHAYKCTAW